MVGLEVFVIFNSYITFIYCNEFYFRCDTFSIGFAKVWGIWHFGKAHAHHGLPQEIGAVCNPSLCTGLASVVAVHRLYTSSVDWTRSWAYRGVSACSSFAVRLDGTNQRCSRQVIGITDERWVFGSTALVAVPAACRVPPDSGQLRRWRCGGCVEQLEVFDRMCGGGGGGAAWCTAAN